MSNRSIFIGFGAPAGGAIAAEPLAVSETFGLEKGL